MIRVRELVIIIYLRIVIAIISHEPNEISSAQGLRRCIIDYITHYIIVVISNEIVVQLDHYTRTDLNECPVGDTPWVIILSRLVPRHCYQ